MYKRHVLKTCTKKELAEIVANGGLNLPIFESRKSLMNRALKNDDKDFAPSFNTVFVTKNLT
jgi:hypothetical protein